MSRFKENFAALDGKKWTALKESVADISEEELQNNNALIGELVRLKLVVETIASSIESVRPFVEFINPDIQNYVKSFENYLNNFKTSALQQKSSHLKNLNNTATTILERVWPFISESSAAQEAGKVFGRYKVAIEDEERNISALRSEADKSIVNIRSISDEISYFRTQLLEESDGKQSAKNEIEEALSKIDEMLRQTQQFYTRLTQGDAKSASILNQIEEAQTTAVEKSSEIEEKLSNVERKLNELDRIHAEIVGVAENGEEQKKGLKSQLEDRRNQLDKMAEGFEKKFEGLVDQIEDLLPGATSAGLATAYSTLRTTAERRALRYSTAFFGLVGFLTIIAVATVTQSFTISPLSWQAITFSEVTEYLTKFLFKLPIILPVLWAALTVSKRRSEMHRLAEEYAHKEALAKSYEGFKKQIIELNKEDNELLTELLAAMLKAVSLNAAKTLDGKHGEKMPVQEVIEEAAKSAVSRISPS